MLGIRPSVLHTTKPLFMNFLRGKTSRAGRPPCWRGAAQPCNEQRCLHPPRKEAIPAESRTRLKAVTEALAKAGFSETARGGGQKGLLSRGVFTFRCRRRGGKACCTGARKHHRPSACPVQRSAGLPPSAAPPQPTRGGPTAPQAPLHLVPVSLVASQGQAPPPASGHLHHHWGP